MDREAWRATVYGVAKSRTRLSDFTSLHFNHCNAPNSGFYLFRSWLGLGPFGRWPYGDFIAPYLVLSKWVTLAASWHWRSFVNIIWSMNEPTTWYSRNFQNQQSLNNEFPQITSDLWLLYPSSLSSHGLHLCYTFRKDASSLTFWIVFSTKITLIRFYQSMYHSLTSLKQVYNYLLRHFV